MIFNTTWVRQPPRLDPVSRQQVTVERIDDLGAAMLNYMTDIISGAQRTPAGGPSVDLAEITPIAAVDLAAHPPNAPHLHPLRPRGRRLGPPHRPCA